MLDKKIKENNYYIKVKNIKEDITIKVISDLHFSKYFNNEKLNIIKNKIFSSKVDYLLVAGDIVDSTNFIYEDNNLVDLYINWFKEIAKKVPIYIVKGNHDIIYLEKKGYKLDLNNEFIRRLKNIDNVFINNKTEIIGNNNISIFMVEPDIKYYKTNNKKYLIKELNKLNKYNLEDNKLKIIMIHSPIYMTDKDILKYTNNFNIVVSGHMHNGAIPFNLGRILPGNRGLISPHKKLFPKLARGIIKTKLEKDNQYLIISGGITKIHSRLSKIRYLNYFYSMEIENIHITK